MSSDEFLPGRAVAIAPGVLRVVAPNASAMTGPGTNTYLLGDPPVAVLDPGPDDARHLAVLCALAPRLERIFITHTHRDHSPLAHRLVAATGARLIGRPPPADGRQDATARPDVVPVRDQCFEAAPGLVLRAIDTPGHASNHVCWLLEPGGLLFSGDHVLDGVTPVILHPDGDLAAYLEALDRLDRYPLRAIAPGHGRVLSEPHAVIDGIRRHRRAREAKVLETLRAAAPATLDALVALVYRDVDPALHVWARMTLEAQLVKLEREGRAGRDAAGRWGGSI